MLYHFLYPLRSVFGGFNVFRYITFRSIFAVLTALMISLIIKKLSYLDQREWDEMEGRILEAEERLEACREAAGDPAVAADHVALAARVEAHPAAQAEVDRLYARWAELEAKARG